MHAKRDWERKREERDDPSIDMSKTLDGEVDGKDDGRTFFNIENFSILGLMEIRVVSSLQKRSMRPIFRNGMCVRLSSRI